jgi:hypothetical protein
MAMYTYFTKIDKVIDGDTVDVFIDLGFNVWHKEIRIFGGRTGVRIASTDSSLDVA